MSDFTRNLFYFFRGPVVGGDGSHEIQLENNLTKSLIVVLEHSRRDVFLRAFSDHLDLPPLNVKASFSLQRRPVGAHISAKRIVLGITGKDPNVLTNVALSSSTGMSRARRHPVKYWVFMIYL